MVWEKWALKIELWIKSRKYETKLFMGPTCQTLILFFSLLPPPDHLSLSCCRPWLGLGIPAAMMARGQGGLREEAVCTTVAKYPP